MTTIGWLQAIVFFLIVLVLTKPLGSYMARVFEGGRTWLTPVFAPLERLIYRLCGVREDEEMSWYAYAFSMLAFSVIGLAYLYILLRTQKWLPLNPQHFDNMTPDLAWNTAVSFTTNTNWQFYSGESAMSRHDARKLLGRSDALLALRPPTDLDRHRSLFRLPRGSSKLPRLSEREVN
jgi:K+-transporting ATPase ATPase A chain